MNASPLDFDRYDHIRPILWTGETLELLDQRKLPFVVEHVSCASSDDVAQAIHALTVRGAPAIGIAAAWGAVLGAREIEADISGWALVPETDHRAAAARAVAAPMPLEAPVITTTALFRCSGMALSFLAYCATTEAVAANHDPAGKRFRDSRRGQEA